MDICRTLKDILIETLHDIDTLRKYSEIKMHFKMIGDQFHLVNNLNIFDKPIYFKIYFYTYYTNLEIFQSSFFSKIIFFEF